MFNYNEAQVPWQNDYDYRDDDGYLFGPSPKKPKSLLEDICEQIAKASSEELMPHLDELYLLSPQAQQYIVEGCENHDTLNALQDGFQEPQDHGALTMRLWDQVEHPDVKGKHSVFQLPRSYSFRLRGTHGEIYMIGDDGVGVFKRGMLCAHNDFPSEPPFHAGIPRIHAYTSYIMAALIVERCQTHDTLWVLTSETIQGWFDIPCGSYQLCTKRIECIRAEAIHPKSSAIFGDGGYVVTTSPYHGSPILYTHLDPCEVIFYDTHDGELVEVWTDNSHHHPSRLINVACSGEWAALSLSRSRHDDQTNVTVKVYKLGFRDVCKIADYISEEPFLHIVDALNVLIICISTYIDIYLLDKLDEQSVFVPSPSPSVYTVKHNRKTLTGSVLDPVDAQSSPSGNFLCILSCSFMIHVFKWIPKAETYTSIRIIDIFEEFIRPIIGSRPGGHRHLRPGEHVLYVDDEKVAFYDDSRAKNPKVVHVDKKGRVDFVYSEEGPVNLAMDQLRRLNKAGLCSDDHFNQLRIEGLPMMSVWDFGPNP